MNRPSLDDATPPPPRERWWHVFVDHPDWLTHWGLAAVILGTTATIDLVPLRDVRRLQSDAVLPKPLDVDKLLEQLGPTDAT